MKKTHVILREADGYLSAVTACGRPLTSNATTLRVNDAGHVDWCSAQAQMFINQPDACRTCMRVIETRSALR